MRIREIRLIRYGKFTDRTLELPCAEQDVHLIVGPNEAGKSTLRQAIGDWLFGIPTRTPMDFLHPMPELRLGGVLEATTQGPVGQAPLDFERAKAQKNTLRTSSDTVLADTTLAPWLSGMRRDVFDRMCGLDHQRLLTGGAEILSATDDVGRMLFQSAAGLSHLGEVQKKLSEEADALWGPRKSKERLYYRGLDAFETAQADCKHQRLQAKDWKAQHDHLEAIAVQLDTAREQHKAWAEEASRLERIRRVTPLLQALDDARLRCEAFSANSPALFDSQAASLLEQAGRDLPIIHADEQRLAQEIAQLTQDDQSTLVDHRALALAEEIIALDEQRLQLRAHRSDIAKRAEEVNAHWRHVQTLAQALGWAADSEDSLRQRLPAARLRQRLAGLIKQHGVLYQERYHAQTQWAQRQREMLDIEQTLQTIHTQAPSPKLSAALDQALRWAHNESQLPEQSQKLAQVDAKIQTTLAAMGHWRMELSALSAMLPPDTATVQTLQARVHECIKENDGLCKAIAAKTQGIEEAELALAQFVQKFQPISRQQLQRARDARDGLWQRIKAQPEDLLTQAPEFEAQIMQADALADARLERAQYEADRQARADHLALQRLECKALEERSRAIEADRQACTHHWQTLAAAGGLASLPLDLASVWLAQRQQALTLWEERKALEEQIQAHHQGVSAAAQALWLALPSLHGSAGLVEMPASIPPLTDCIHQARAHITAADQAMGRRSTLEKQAADVRASLWALHTALAGAQDAENQWQEKWASALQEAGYAPHTSPDDIEAEIEHLQEIDRLLLEMASIRRERIDTMEADLNAFAAQARALADSLDPALAMQPADAIALALKQRLTLAQQTLAQSQRLQKQRGQAQAQWEAARQKQQSIHASLAPLLQRAGASDLDGLAAAIARSDAYRQITGQINALLQELMQAGDGYTEAQLREQAAGITPDALKAQLQALGQQSSDIVGQIQALGAEHGRLQNTFNALDNTAGAAQAEAHRQEAIATMADAMARYIRLQTAVRLLQWAMEKFRQTQQGPMLAQASQLFKTLTLEGFDRLLVDSDERGQPRLVCIRPSGQRVHIAAMSEGTRDQLYLALRLAALQLHSRDNLALPFIADDLFINFDDQRTQAGLTALGTVSRQVQIIVLTHHEHLVDLAYQALGPRLNVVRL